MSDIPYNQRIQNARERLGLKQEQVAESVGISSDWYRDLEGSPKEIGMTLDIRQVQKLCQTLQIEPYDLLAPADAEKRPTPMSFQELLEKISGYIEREKISLEAFEDKAGWSIESSFKDPNKCLSWNLDCLLDVTLAIKVDWLRIITSNFKIFNLDKS